MGLNKNGLKLNDGADLVVAVFLTVVGQTVTVVEVRVPRAVTIVHGRRPSVGAGCELCPTRSAESCVYGALIIVD